MTGDLLSPPVLALIVAFTTGLIAFFGLGLNRRRKLEARVGLATLDTMRWREFAQLVIEMMRRRGLVWVHDDPGIGNGGYDIKFERGNQSYLVQVKQGRTTRVDAGTLRTLRTAIADEGAGGGTVVTAGIVDPEVRDPQGGVTLEVLHGEALWKNLLPLLPEHVRHAALARSRRLLTLRWLALALCAVLAGSVVFFLPRGETPLSAPATLIPTRPNETPTAVSTPADTQVSKPPAPLIREVPILTDAEADARRGAALATVRTLDEVREASWSTRSTLVILLNATEPTQRRLIAERICEHLVKYEELRYTRLQIQAPEDRVHWARCQ